MPADVTNPADVKRLIAAAQKQIRGLDVLINNAGVFTYKPFAKTSLEDWRRNLDTNLTSIFLMTQAALPLLKRSKGDVLNILSISSRVAFPNCSAYSAVKVWRMGIDGRVAARASRGGYPSNGRVAGDDGNANEG